MLTIVIYISQHLISSTFVSDVYGLMRCILYLFLVTPHCNETVLLVKHCVITNWVLYGVSHYYQA